MTPGSPTDEQINFMLTFLEKYTPLARGYLRSTQNRIRGKKLWEEPTRKLNALGGANKSTKQWQKETDEDSLETDEASAADAFSPGPQRQHVRRRQALQEGTFRSRLFRMEKSRLAVQKLQAQELGAIRRSLDTLVNLLQMYMEKK